MDKIALNNIEEHKRSESSSTQNDGTTSKFKSENDLYKDEIGIAHNSEESDDSCYISIAQK